MLKKYKSFLKIARICVVFIGGLMVAMFISLSQVNLETLRGNLLSVMRDSTGLPVEIDGDISWKFSLRPKVELNKVRVPNAEWAANKDGFTAEKIDLTLNLISLFRDKPTIQNIRVYNSVLLMEENEKGEYSISPQVTAGDHDNKYPFDMDFGLGGIELRNAVAHIGDSIYFLAGLQINYSSGKSSKEYSGWLKSEEKLYPFIISFSELNEERKVYPVRVALSTGGEALVANIALEATSKMPIDFIVKGTIADVASLGQVFDLGLPNIPPIKINIVGGFDHKKLNLRKSSMNIRNSDIGFSGGLDWSGKIPNIDLKINAKQINLMELFPELYAGGKTKWVRPNRDLNVFKDVPLYGRELLNYNLTLAANVGDLIVYRDLSIQSIDAKVKLNQGKMRTDVRAVVAEGEVTAATEISADSDGKLTVRGAGIGERIYVGEIMKSLRVDDFVSELPSNFEFYLEGSGSNLSEMMSTVTGPIYVYSVAPGYAHSELVTYVYGTDFLTDLRHNIQNLFRSKKKDDQLTISCAALNVKVRNGRIETEQGIAAETNAVNLRLTGNIDFGTENMRASLVTVPVRGIKLSLTGNVVNSISFIGNLAEPDIRINGAAVAGKVASATGLGLLLAPFTGGIGLVAGAGVGFLAGDLLENWLADEHPCRTARERGTRVRDGDPEWMKRPMAELVSELLK